MENSKEAQRTLAELKDRGLRGLKGTDRATTRQCQALKARGIFATPNTHTVEEASRLLDETASRATPRQKQFAVKLGIDPVGKTKAELSDLIEERVKARQITQPMAKTDTPSPKTRTPKPTGIARHSAISVIRALAARGLGAERIVAAMVRGGIRDTGYLTVNRGWLNRQIADANGKKATLTADDLAAMGVIAC